MGIQLLLPLCRLILLLLLRPPPPPSSTPSTDAAVDSGPPPTLPPPPHHYHHHPHTDSTNNKFKLCSLNIQSLRHVGLSLDGKGTFHGMGMIAAMTPGRQAI